MKAIYNWNQALKKRTFRWLVASAVVVLIFSLSLIRYFLTINEARPGFAFEDPLLKVIPPHNLTWPIFLMLHLFIAWGVYLVLQNPRKAVVWANAYSIMVFFRFLAMSLLPLAPPLDMVFLKDPIIAAFMSTATPIRDLFFSGHTATSFLFYLEFRKTKWGLFFLIDTLFLAAAVLIQHVHYSVDVLAAPFFAYFSYKLAIELVARQEKWLKRFMK